MIVVKWFGRFIIRHQKLKKEPEEGRRRRAGKV